jgi:hypothetical protein
MDEALSDRLILVDTAFELQSSPDLKARDPRCRLPVGNTRIIEYSECAGRMAATPAPKGDGDLEGSRARMFPDANQI